MREACFPVGCESLALPDPTFKKEQAQGPGTTQSQGTRPPQPDRGGMLKITAQGCPDRGVLEDACSIISSTGSGTAPAIPWSQQSE